MGVRPKADGDGGAVGPVGDLAGFNDGAGAGLTLHLDGDLKIDLFSPSRRLAVDRKLVPDRVSGLGGKSSASSAIDPNTIPILRISQPRVDRIR
jgi:hypothetical protein